MCYSCAHCIKLLSYYYYLYIKIYIIIYKDLLINDLLIEMPQRRRQPSKIMLLLQARPAAPLPMVGREGSDTVAASGGSEHRQTQ